MVSLPVLCLLSAVIAQSAGDLLISDLEKNKHLLLNDDLALLKDININCGGPIFKSVKARKAEDGLIVYNLHLKHIKVYKISKDDKVSEIRKIAINGNDLIDVFDVQPSGDLLVMSTMKEIYLFSQIDSKVTEVLGPDRLDGDVVGNVLIHPTKRIIYYSTCNKRNYLVFSYNLQTTTNNSFKVPFCFFQLSFDTEENIIWGTSRNRIATLNLNNGDFEIICKKDKSFFTASNSYELYLVDFGAKNFQKLYKTPKLQKHSDLPGFKIEPVLSRLKETPVLFNIEEGAIELLDENFSKTGEKISLKIEKKSIKSIRSSTDGGRTTTFFWIHESNERLVQFAKINHITNVVTERNHFEIENNDSRKNLIDREPFKSSYAVPQFHPHIESLSHPVNKPEPIEVQQSKRKLFDSHCGDFNLPKFIFNFQEGQQPFSSISACPEKVSSDDESTSSIWSTNSGLYVVDSDEKYEQIYNDKNIKNFVIDKDYVYFVGTRNGPGIYKINRRRTVEMRHKLHEQLEQLSVLTITNVKEEKQKNCESTAKKEVPLNSNSSRMASTCHIFLLIFVQFVSQLLREN